ncbi:MAG: hydrolase [Parcubacteria group bacterium]|nr:hydrolase [Parcubacteria group bacterium]
MKKTTLIFCVKEDQILLAMKKRGFGSGKWNGYGGKVEETENISSAAVRELKEESNLIAEEKDLKQVAVVNFYFDGEHKFECHVFLLKEWNGDAEETEEMNPKWFPKNELPYSEMWVADAKWLPIVLENKQILVTVNFNKEGNEIKNFEYSETNF